MKKQSIRSFALGMLLTVSILGVYYYYIQEETVTDDISMNIDNAKKLVKEEGYMILSESEYNDLRTKQKELVKESPPTDTSKKTESTEDVKELEEESYKYTLKITRGMSISSISKLLEKHKIIENREKFETFLTKNGYQTDIQVGSFKLNSDMSLKKIAKIITGD
ncbi:MAG TPA: hypothetical protein VNR61_11760 [Niallia sp.]|nr:hypothetical protein [Niallia sp.]